MSVWALRCLYICLESVSLHKILYVSVSSHAGTPVGILGVSLVCLHGVWCRCSNDQQVCSIVSIFTALYWWEKRLVAQPYRATSICTNVWGSPPPPFFSACLIIGVWSPHTLQTPCLSLFWPLTHPCLGIKRYLVENLTRANSCFFFLPKCGLWLRFSFEHHVRGGCDRYKSSRSHGCKTFGNVYHLLLECGGTEKRIPGGRV